MKKKKNKEPKLVGVWVVAATPHGDLLKWGKDDDSIYPYPPDGIEASKQAKYLRDSPAYKDATFWILNVFDNGQIKQAEFIAEEQPVKTFKAILSAKQVEAYLADPGLCLFCERSTVHHRWNQDPATDTYKRICHCNSCGQEWADIYQHEDVKTKIQCCAACGVEFRHGDAVVLYAIDAPGGLTSLHHADCKPRPPYTTRVG